MKLFVGVLLTAFVAVNGAAIDSSVAAADSVAIAPLLVAPTDLFEKAWTYQALVKSLQNDINEQLTSVRTAVSTVLSSSTDATLTQIASNKDVILALDASARDEVYAVTSSVCVNTLKVLLNGITEYTGFGSANCVTAYDNSAQEVLTSAYALLQKYEGSYSDVQQNVVRAFIGNNVFLDSEQIEANFAEVFSTSTAEWEAIRPEIEDFVSSLASNIAVFNTVLGDCFGAIQSGVAPAYAALQSQLATCEAFHATADPFAVYRQ